MTLVLLILNLLSGILNTICGAKTNDIGDIIWAFVNFLLVIILATTIYLKSL